MFRIGSRIPDPYYSLLTDTTIARIVHRKCPTCGEEWPNSEVPLYKGWIGTYADCCPVHFTISRIKGFMSVHKAQDLTHQPSRGMMNVLMYGGFYRRRECQSCCNCVHNRGRHFEWAQSETSQYKRVVPSKPKRCSRIMKDLGQCECEEFEPCLKKNGKPTRWSTGEFSVDGIVLEDVTKCPRCRDVGRVIKLRRSAMGSRMLRARQAAKRRLLDPEATLADGRDPLHQPPIDPDA